MKIGNTVGIKEVMTMKARGPITRRRLVLGTCVASAAAVMSPAFTLESNAAFGKSTTMWNECMGDSFMFCFFFFCLWTYCFLFYLGFLNCFIWDF